jgi:hypothetical protein
MLGPSRPHSARDLQLRDDYRQSCVLRHAFQVLRPRRVVGVACGLGP